MNQKEYKAIAKIIEKRVPDGFYEEGDFARDNELRGLAYDLAEYFQKEDSEHTMGRPNIFNKEQFLKDCGVKE